MAGASNKTCDYSVAVIGAGIVGTMTALELQRRGYQVTLLDREGPAAGCSFGNGGAIGPNTCTPFALPGILRKLPKWYLDPMGPVTVKPRWALQSLPWIWRWLRNSREDRARRSSVLMKFLHDGCLDTYRTALGAEHFSDLMRENGYLYVYRSEKPALSEVVAARLRDELGIPATYLSEAELRQIEPDLAPVFRRGVILSGNGHTVNPARLVHTLFDLFQEAGGHFLKADVRAMQPEDGRLPAIALENQQLRATHYVLCAGIESGELAKRLGAQVPLVAERGYHVSFPDSEINLRHKVMNGSAGFGATQMETGLQVSGTVELDTPDAAPDWRRTDAMIRQASGMFRKPLPHHHTRWMGQRPSLPDSLPILDRAPAARNVYLNFGHSHWGLSGAPRSARIIADMIAGAVQPSEVGQLSATRF